MSPTDRSLKVTVTLERAKRLGVEIVNISVLLDKINDSLTVYGELLALPSYRLDDESAEIGIASSFHNEGGKTLLIKRATQITPFRRNLFSYFSVELSAADNLILETREIRLSPFLISCT